MARFNQLKNNFLGGLISKRALGRTDLPQHQQGCEEMENCIVQTPGGFRVRPGTRYIANAYSNTGQVRLIPFIYSQTESYMIEISSTRFRAFNIQNGNITDIGANSLLTSILLSEIQFAQEADILYLVHSSKEPVLLTRTAADTFTISKLSSKQTSGTEAEASQFPYRAVNTTATTMSISGTTVGNTYNVTFSAATLNAGHVGTYFKLNVSGTMGAVKIVTVTSSTTGTARVVVAPGGTTATAIWYEASWSDYRGWPRTITFFEGRLAYGGNTAEPDTIWFSTLLNYYQLDTVTTSVAADLKYFQATLRSSQLNRIQWLSAKQVLNIGTSGAEWTAKAADPQLSFASNNCQFTEYTNHGSAYVQPIKASNSTVFLTADYKRLREFVFNFESDSYIANDLSYLAEPLTGKVASSRTYISHMAWSESDSTLWCVDFGELIGMTWERQKGVFAWHYHKLAGSYGSNPPSVESIAVAPSNDGTHDDLWISVIRTINGSTKRYIEVINSEFQFASLNSTEMQAILVTQPEYAPFFSDCAKYVYNSPASTTVSGLSHLEAETVQVLADGKYVGTKTVSGGAITLTTAASQIVVGLEKSWKAKLIKPEMGALIGSTQGAIMRIDRVNMKFYRTIGVSVGSSESEAEELDFRDAGAAIGAEIIPYTGEKTVDFRGSPDREQNVLLFGSDPYPVTVVSVAMRGDTRDQ